jgi:hypothetical protein
MAEYKPLVFNNNGLLQRLQPGDLLRTDITGNAGTVSSVRIGIVTHTNEQLVTVLSAGFNEFIENVTIINTVPAVDDFAIASKQNGSWYGLVIPSGVVVPSFPEPSSPDPSFPPDPVFPSESGTDGTDPSAPDPSDSGGSVYSVGEANSVQSAISTDLNNPINEVSLDPI